MRELLLERLFSEIDDEELKGASVALDTIEGRIETKDYYKYLGYLEGLKRAQTIVREVIDG